MKLTLIQKIVIFIDILILAALPFIAAQGTLSVSKNTTPSPLSEATLSPVAKFKSYEDSLSYVKEAKSAPVVKPQNHSHLAGAIKSQNETVLVMSESIGATRVEPTPTSTPKPEVQAAIAVAPSVLSPEAIAFLGNCESGMNPTTNTGNGYYGAFQFSYGTWKSMGTEYERADLAPLEVQIDAVQRLVARSSIYGQFPACAQKMKSAGLI